MDNSPGVKSLTERMRATSTKTAQPAQRERRFSDADRHRRSSSLSSRSVEGSSIKRPMPSETSRIVRRQGNRTSEDDSKCYQILPPHECNNAICSVAEVFDTTELLELILGFLRTNHVLDSRLVRRDFNSLVQDSPQLRLHLFVKPCWRRPAAEFNLLPLMLPGVDIRLGEPVHLGYWIEVEMSLAAARRIAEVAQSRRRVRSRSIFEGMRRGFGPARADDDWPYPTADNTKVSPVPVLDQLFITQPPLVGMQVYTETATRSDSLGNTERPSEKPLSKDQSATSDDDNVPFLAANAKVFCDAGITLGFLADTAMSLLNGKSTNTKGESSRSVDQDRRVLFQAILSFCQTDTAPRQRSDSRTLTKII